MRSQILSLAAIALMLPACAGSGGHHDPAVTRHQAVNDHEDPQRSVTPASHHRPNTTSSRHYPSERSRHGPRKRDHHHHHPTPEEIYAGQVALLFSAQIFACAFVVVILDGSCDFYASTGFYY